MAVFDTNFLVFLLEPNKPAPIDPKTDQPVTHAKARIEHLVRTLEQVGEKIILPTPVLSEFLVKAGMAAAEYLQLFDKQAVFRIMPFDTRCAVELAEMTRSALAAADKSKDEPRQKVKIDRQIIAIAKVNGQHTIYSTDQGLAGIAALVGIKVVSLAEIPLPPEDMQGTLNLGNTQKTD